MNNDLIEKLEQCGWFDELPAEKSAQLKSRLATDDPEDPLGALCLTDVDIDMECIDTFGQGDGEIIESYTDILLQLAAVSQGRFAPTAIVDELNEAEGTVRIAFDFDGRHYETQLKYEDDWADPEIFELVETALADAGIEQRFLALPYADQVVYLAFISPKTFQLASDSGVFAELESDFDI